MLHSSAQTTIAITVGHQRFTCENSSATRAVAVIWIATHDANGEEGEVVVTRNGVSLGVRLEDAHVILPILAEYERTLASKPAYVDPDVGIEMQQEVTDEDVVDALDNLVLVLRAFDMDRDDVRRFVAFNDDTLRAYFDGKEHQLGLEAFERDFGPNEDRCAVAADATEKVIERIFGIERNDGAN